jgi:leucyl/phenylalanyl-tRNA--protein transferase
MYHSCQQWLIGNGVDDAKALANESVRRKPRSHGRIARVIPWLRNDTAFPPIESALSEPNGLLAAGGGLSVKRLLMAYRRGIFPWYGEAQPVLWWTPDPRMVLFVGEFRVTRSLRKVVRSGRFDVRIDSAFRAVIEACARAPRAGQLGTWITPEVVDAYTELHECGYAHSVESWREGNLVGGLYGVSIGRMFFGESMFALETDASKVALVHLVDRLHWADCPLIDCQQQTGHLARLGARPISRPEFAEHLASLVNCAAVDGMWATTLPSSVPA